MEGGRDVRNERGSEGEREGVMEGGRCVMSFALLLLERDSASLSHVLR